MPLGLYLSVPFCRTKCSYCNFASDVFSRVVFQRYVDRLCSDIANAAAIAEQMGGQFDSEADSVYLGGGTPTLLDSHQLEKLFVTIRQNFFLMSDAEITVECAPGTLNPAMLDTLLRCGVNRVSLGVQSFVDQEAAAVGRLHKRTTTLDDVARLRAAGVSNINVDLIAGLPHQTAKSWQVSLSEALSTGVPHVSVYMLEVDDDSRLGRELMAGGTRYHAHSVPDDDLTADLYVMACEQLDSAGVRQYEISNFAREGCESRHNLKYWTRQPYLGFGVDAHSMLFASADPYLIVEAGENTNGPGGSPPCEALAADIDAVRIATPDSLEQYVADTPPRRTPVGRRQALEETFFLGLRLNRGVDLRSVVAHFGPDAVQRVTSAIHELLSEGLLQSDGSIIRLTPRGRLLSNEVFERFLTPIEV
jgi:oxygen-independent coproporphyrinogen-3 oxidase